MYENTPSVSRFIHERNIIFWRHFHLFYLKIRIMSAQYTMQEIREVNNPDKTLLYPKMVIKECCSEETVARLAAEGSTFHSGELQGMFKLLGQALASLMAEGCSVKIEGLGVFTPSLSLKKGKNRETVDGNGPSRNAQSLEVGGVNFRPSKQLLAEINSRCSLERAPRQFRLYRSQYTPEERLSLALNYLETHAMLPIQVYASLTGLGRTTAGKELRMWGETPGSGIRPEGRGTHLVYVKSGQSGSDIK